MSFQSEFWEISELAELPKADDWTRHEEYSNFRVSVGEIPSWHGFCPRV